MLRMYRKISYEDRDRDAGFNGIVILPFSSASGSASALMGGKMFRASSQYCSCP